MSNIIPSQTPTMSSKELYEIICLARSEHGESQPRLNDFHARVSDELQGEYYETFVVQNSNKTESTFFKLNIEQCMLVGMRESKAVRRSVLDKIKLLESQQQKPLSQVEILAQSAMALVEHEKKLIQLEQNQSDLEQRLEKLKESTAIMPVRPTNSESISFIRTRMNKKYGLPPRIVNDVLYSSPYAPKPAGQVRNNHENAGNATYTVWYSSDVTKLFKRFVAECEMVTKTQAVHALIDGRFKLINEKEEGEAV